MLLSSVEYRSEACLPLHVPNPLEQEFVTCVASTLLQASNKTKQNKLKQKTKT
eukprot:m.155641 g.155641  ORF g.155641 m.155641 type:complete len:53 (-) comp24660_c0_seq2:849-1007(-)